MNINELVEKAHKNAVEHGFWEKFECMEVAKKITQCGEMMLWNENNAIGNMLMLIVSELSEAQEGLRHNDQDNFREELADVAIRLADLCGGLDIDLEAEIAKKMEYNKSRPYKHGKEF